MAEGQYNVNVVVRVINQMSDKLNAIAEDTKNFKTVAAASLMFVGQQFYAMGQKARQAVNELVGAFADFDAAMKNSISIMSGGIEHEKELADMANALAKEYGVSADMIAKGYYQLASAGYDANEILKLTPGILKLSKATMTDFYTTADITTTALNAFGYSADKTNYVANVLMNTVKSGKTTLSELAITLPYAGAAAAAAGVDIQTLGAAIVTLRNAGIDASMAGTQLRQIFARLVDPTVQEKLRAIGVEIVKNKDGSLDFTATLQNLHDALSKVGDKTEQLAVLNNIFGLRAANAAKILADESSNLKELSSQLGDTSALTEAMNIQMTSTATKLAQANERVMEAKRAWGEALAPSLIAVKNAEASVYEWAANLPEPLKDIIAIGMEGAGIFGQFGGALMGVAGLLQILGPIKATFSAIFTTTTEAETAAQWSFNAAVLANPLTWVIIAIIAAVLLLWHYWKPIIENMRKLWEALSSKISDAYENVIKPVFGAIADFFKGVFNSFYNALKDFWDNILSPIFSGMRDFIGSVWNAFISSLDWSYNHVIKPIMDAIAWFWDNVLSPVLDGIKAFTSAAGSIIGSIKEGIGSVLSFDNPRNDALAHRWGRDFARHFMNGVTEVLPNLNVNISPMPSPAGSNITTNNVTIEINGANMRVDEIIEEINELYMLRGA